MNIIQWILAFLSVPVAAGCLAPMIARWLPRIPSDVFWPVSFALSIGILTIALAAIGLLGLTSLSVLFVLIGFWSVSLAWGKRSHPIPDLTRWWAELRSGKSWAWIILAILFIITFVLAQATYYPFTGDDEISRYAYFARRVFSQKIIEPEVRGYPMLLPLSYAITFFASGGLAEQAAKLFPVLFSAMTIVATYALARRWFGSRAGWAAALTLAATPLFIRWAPVGYLDIPSGLYLVLGAYSADVWREKLDARWALLTGILAGLAVWAKQSGLVMLPTLGWIVFTVIHSKRRSQQPAGVKSALLQGVLMLAAAMLAGGWWYVRNTYYDGWAGAIPDAGLYHLMQASPSLSQIIPFVGHFTTFGYLTSLLYLGGLTQVAAKHERVSTLRCLMWCVPYTILWWWRFSYDARFLLTVLPLYAILSGKWIAGIENRWLRSHTVRNTLVLALACTGVIQARLGGSIQWLTHPTATYEERLTRATGDLYPAVKYLQQQTDPTSRIYSMDGRILYYLIDRKIAVGYPLSTDVVIDYDYFLVGSWAESVYNSLGILNNPMPDLDDTTIFQKVHTGSLGGLVIYKVLHP